MSKKIKAIIKRPDEKVGHMTWISNTLENLQKTVGGRLEVVTMKRKDPCVVMIVHEEGKIKKLDPNFWMGSESLGDMIVGTAIICGAEGCEFTDVPIDISVWKHLLVMWGNAL